MFQVKRLDIASLDEQSVRAYEKLAPPQYCSCLHGKQPEDIEGTVIVAIGGELQGKPVGLLLASYFVYVRLADVHSVFVDEVYRRKTVGTQLIALLERELIALKCAEVTWAYPEWDPSVIYLERIFRRLKWTPPQPFKIHCLFDVSAFQADWFLKKYKNSQAFSIFSWSELSTKEREKLKSKLKQGVIPSHVSPFMNEDTIEPVNSLGLRYRGEVVGWMITHREEADTIRYFALYIIPQFQSLGESIKLLCESIRRQQATDIRWGVLEVNMPKSSPGWTKFIQRRLVPYAKEVKYTRFSRKAF